MRMRTMAIIRPKRDRKVEMSENDYDESDVVVVHQFHIFFFSRFCHSANCVNI